MAMQHDPVAFPTLDDAQIAALGKFATLKSFQAGERLFAAGQRDFQFFVVKSGEVEIVDHSSGRDKTVTIHQAREFTGAEQEAFDVTPPPRSKEPSMCHYQTSSSASPVKLA